MKKLIFLLILIAIGYGAYYFMGNYPQNPYVMQVNSFFGNFNPALFPGEKIDTTSTDIYTGSTLHASLSGATLTGETTVCTMDYTPVCAKVQIQCIKAPCEPIEQTFGNKCMMNANKLATFIHDGECTSKK